MKKRNSRYIIGEASFSAIARQPVGDQICLTLNPAEQDAQKEVSKSLKAAFSRMGRQCQVQGGSAHQPFPSRRPPEGIRATHLWVRILSDVPAESYWGTLPETRKATPKGGFSELLLSRETSKRGGSALMDNITP